MAKTSLLGSAGITTITVLCMLLADPVASQDRARRDTICAPRPLGVAQPWRLA
jgi:hypothetical protein